MLLQVLDKSRRTARRESSVNFVVFTPGLFSSLLPSLPPKIPCQMSLSIYASLFLVAPSLPFSPLSMSVSGPGLSLS